MKLRFLFFLFLFLPFFSFAQFQDIEGNRYQEDIQKLAQKDIVQGYPGNLYKPDQTITRAELLKIILFAANIDMVPSEEKCFSDVKPNERFHDIVCSAKAMGIVEGYPDGKFRPYQKVSFVEGLKIAIVGFGVQTKESDSSLWYQKYLDFVHQNSIFSKYEFFPEQDLTRGMMAHLAIKLMEGQSGSWDYVRSSRSVGCGKSEPFSAPDTFFVGGLERHAIVDLSRYNANSSSPAKLIVAFHGRRTPNSGLGYFGLSSAVDGNAIIVYPAGLPEEGPERNWRSPGDRPRALRDYQFFDAIVDEFSNNYCINPDEIYVVGHSLGGWFTSMLNCARGNVVRGAGIVAGSPMLFPACSGPSAAIIFHNPADYLASFGGGEQIRDKILKQNHCGPETEVYPNSYGMECLRYTSCLPGAGVVFCKYFDGDHMWPSGAEQMMMKFWKEE